MDSADDENEEGGGSGPFVRSLSRGIAVLEAMGASKMGMGLSEVSSIVGLDRATARRILLTLEQLRYVSSQDGRYTLRPSVLDLGYVYLSTLPLWTLAEPQLDTIVEATQENSSIGVLDHGEVLYVARRSSDRRVVSINLPVGARLPAYCTAMGRVMLAAQEPEAMEAHLSRVEMVRHTSFTVVDEKRLRGILADVRRQGWAHSIQEYEEGVQSVAVPLHDRTGRVVAALNVSAPTSRVSPPDFLRQSLPVLRLAAQGIDQISSSL